MWVNTIGNAYLVFYVANISLLLCTRQDPAKNAVVGLAYTAKYQQEYIIEQNLTHVQNDPKLQQL